MRKFLSDVASRTAAGVLTSLLFILVPLAWPQVRARVADALLSSVPAYYVVVAGLAGVALTLGAWSRRDRRVRRSPKGRQWTSDEQRLLAFVHQGGAAGVDFSEARANVGLDAARFDLLVHGLRALILSEAWGAYRAAPDKHILTITRSGKEVLAQLLKQNPHLLGPGR